MERRSPGWLPGRATVLVAAAGALTLAVVAAERGPTPVPGGTTPVVAAPAPTPPPPQTLTPTPVPRAAAEREPTDPASGGVWDRYPELAEGDAALVRDLLPRREPASVPTASSAPDAALDRLGARAGTSVLRLLFERSLGSSREAGSGLRLPVAFVADAVTRPVEETWWDPRHDASMAPAATYLARRPDDVCDRVVRRALVDPELPFSLRFQCAVAAARPGDAAGADALATLALDASASTNLRQAALLRISRCGVAPRRLRALLYSPWEGLDRTAALALAACGDPEAPTLVLRSLRRSAQRIRARGTSSLPADAASWLGAESVFALRRDDPVPARAADRAMEALRAAEPGGSGSRGDLTTAFEDLVREYEAWLDRDPHARDSEFERRLRAQRAASAGLSDAQPRSFDAIVARGDDAFDVGAAAVVLADPALLDECLEQLDVLACGLREPLRLAATPRAKLDVLNRILPESPAAPDVVARSTDLTELLATGRGDCLGWTCLYLALGERLGLPLHGVGVPGHAFVRWDDGSTRINVDPLNRGAFRTDASYARDFRLSGPTDPELRNLRPREVLSLVCSNFAARALQTWFPGEAVAWARKALVLDADNDDAVVNLGAALVRSADVDADEVREAFRPCVPVLVREAERDPEWAWTLLWAGETAEARRALEPAAPSGDVVRLRALAGLAQGDVESARAALAGGQPRIPEASRRALVRAIRWADGDVDALHGDMDRDVRIEVASVLVLFRGDPARRSAAARAALDLLEAERPWFESRFGEFYRWRIERRERVVFPTDVAARAWFETSVRARRVLGDAEGIGALEAFVFGPGRR